MKRLQHNHDFFKLTFIFLLFILSACGTSNVKISTATLPIPTITNTPTKTPTPTSTITPSPTATAVFNGFGLSIDLVKALGFHAGLESSISKGTDGQYTVTATILSSDSQSITQSTNVIPSTLNENLASKNKFENTPTMQTADGRKLYWIQEEQGWFAVEISTDINKPVFIPFDQRVIATRVIVAEFNQPFSQDALDRWNKYPSLKVGFQFLNVNAKTGENTKFAYLENGSMLQPGLTKENSEVQILDAWFSTILSDGTVYQFFPTKWLDPMTPNNPKGDDWKIVFAASGQEIMGDKNNREKFDHLVTQAATPGTRMKVYPIVAVDDNFFNSTNNLFTFGAAQPSLIKLLKQTNNTINDLTVPNRPGDKFDFWLKDLLDQTNASQTSMQFYFPTNQDPAYKTNFFPSDIQTIIFPSMIIFR